jgi:hypothetical protein
MCQQQQQRRRHFFMQQFYKTDKSVRNNIFSVHYVSVPGVWIIEKNRKVNI